MPHLQPLSNTEWDPSLPVNATSRPRDYACLLCWQQSYSSKLSNLKRRGRHSNHVTCWVPRVRTHKKALVKWVCPAITSPGNFTITHICRNYGTRNNNMIKDSRLHVLNILGNVSLTLWESSSWPSSPHSTEVQHPRVQSSPGVVDTKAHLW